MLEYIHKIIVTYVESQRELIKDNKLAVVIIDNFKGQMTPAVMNDNNIHMCFLPPNTTDKLQQLNVLVNKPVKDILKEKFQGWYAK